MLLVTLALLLVLTGWLEKERFGGVLRRLLVIGTQLWAGIAVPWSVWLAFFDAEQRRLITDGGVRASALAMDVLFTWSALFLAWRLVRWRRRRSSGAPLPSDVDFSAWGREAAVEFAAAASIVLLLSRGSVDAVVSLARWAGDDLVLYGSALFSASGLTEVRDLVRRGITAASPLALYYSVKGAFVVGFALVAWLCDALGAKRWLPVVVMLVPLVGARLWLDGAEARAAEERRRRHAAEVAALKERQAELAAAIEKREAEWRKALVVAGVGAEAPRAARLSSYSELADAARGVLHLSLAEEARFELDDTLELAEPLLAVTHLGRVYFVGHAGQFGLTWGELEAPGDLIRADSRLDVTSFAGVGRYEGVTASCAAARPDVCAVQVTVGMRAEGVAPRDALRIWSSETHVDSGMHLWRLRPEGGVRVVPVSDLTFRRACIQGASGADSFEPRPGDHLVAYGTSPEEATAVALVVAADDDRFAAVPYSWVVEAEAAPVRVRLALPDLAAQIPEWRAAMEGADRSTCAANP